MTSSSAMAPISTGSNGNPACRVNPAANAAAVTTIATRTMTSSIASPPGSGVRPRQDLLE